MIQDGEFIEPESPDHPNFLKQAERLKSGEQDWFVGACIVLFTDWRSVTLQPRAALL